MFKGKKRRTDTIIMVSASLAILLFSWIAITSGEKKVFSEQGLQVTISVSHALRSNDNLTAGLILNEAVRWRHFEEIEIYDQNSTLFAQAMSRNSSLVGKFENLVYPRVHMEMPVKFNGQVIGRAHLTAISRRINYLAFIALLTAFVMTLMHLLQVSQRRNSLLSKTLNEILVLQEDLLESRKHASLGALLRGMAHEMNTPLGNAVTLSTTLGSHVDESSVSEKPLNPEYTKELSAALNISLQRIVDLMDRIKQLEVATKEEEYGEYSLLEVFEHSWLLFTQQYPEGTGLPKFKLHRDQRILGNKALLAAIFTELIDNTFAHGSSSPEGLQELTVQVDAYQAGGQIVLEYRNDGLPIDEGLQEYIFDPFTGSTRKGKHIGIGLHIVRYLLGTFSAASVSYVFHKGDNIFRLRFGNQTVSDGSPTRGAQHQRKQRQFAAGIKNRLASEPVIR